MGLCHSTPKSSPKQLEYAKKIAQRIKDNDNERESIDQEHQEHQNRINHAKIVAQRIIKEEN